MHFACTQFVISCESTGLCLNNKTFAAIVR